MPFLKPHHLKSTKPPTCGTQSTSAPPCGCGTLFHQTTPPPNPLCHPHVAASLKLASHPHVALPPPRDLLIIAPLPKVPT